MVSDFPYGTIYRLCGAREYFPELGPGFDLFEVAVADGLPEPWVILRAPCTNVLLVSRRFDLAVSLGCRRHYDDVVTRLQEMVTLLSTGFPLSVFDPKDAEVVGSPSSVRLGLVRCFGRQLANDVY